MIVDDFKKSILLYAMSGKLVEQSDNDTNVENMINEMSTIRNNAIKNRISKNDIYKEVDRNLLFDIPKTWTWIRVGEIGNWGSGSTPERGNINYYKNGTISWLKTGELNDGFVGDSEEKITEQALKECSLKINKPGDVLIAMYGATIGKLGIATIETTTNQACCGCTLYCNVNNKYLFYYLLSIRSKLLSMGEGSGQPNVSREKIINLPFPLAPIEEQERIVEKLDKIFEMLEETKTIENEINLLKTNITVDMIKSILNFAYTGKLVYGNSSYSEWDEKPLNKIADIYTGNSISESIKKAKYTNLDNGYNYIATKDLEFSHTFNYENGIKIPFEEAGFKYADKNDILMCIEGGSAGRKIGILSEKVCFGNKLCKFGIITNEIDSKFLYYYLQSPVFLKNFYENLSGIIGGVSINKIKKILIKYPPIDEQKRIVNKIEQLLHLCNDIKKIVNG